MDIDASVLYRIRCKHFVAPTFAGKGASQIPDFVVIAYICLCIPFILMLAFLEPRSRRVFSFAIVGMTVALITSQINSILLEFSGNNYFNTTVNITPVTEEIAKAIPVLFFTFVMAEKREDIISTSYSVGFGFAMLENITIFLQSTDSLSILWVLSRGVGAGLMHGICTASIGMGMSFVKYQNRLFLPGTLSLLIFAILYHSIFNTLVQSENLRQVGVLLPIFTYIPFLVIYWKRIRKNQEYK